MRRLISLIMLSVSVFPLAAQTDRASLTGVVMDPSRSVVPGAKISLQAAATGIEYSALTNSAGVYTVSGLLVGQYTATIAVAGFETVKIQNFALEVGETRTLNVALRVGSVSSNVTVVDATPDLNLTSSEVGGVITGKQTDALPARRNSPTMR